MKINLLSSPRNRSTLLMYSFAQRKDITVIDEPFYAYYLNRSKAIHPGADAIISSQSTEYSTVQSQLVAHTQSPILFIKNMAHHYFLDELDGLTEFKNIIYIRNPRAIIRSYSRVIENPTTTDVGIKQVRNLYQHIIELGHKPIVLDSDDLISDPEKILKNLCQSLSISFQPSMLHWKQGPKPYDGVWAPYWYQSVHSSSGFHSQKNAANENIKLSEQHEAVAQDCLEDYSYLKKFAI